MTKIIPTLALAGALLLGACAHPTPTQPTWEKPGVTFKEWLADEYACQRDRLAYESTLGRGWGTDRVSIYFYYRCLEAKGYSRVQ
jgi:hypothetical protein